MPQNQTDVVGLSFTGILAQNMSLEKRGLPADPVAYSACVHHANIPGSVRLAHVTTHGE